MIGRIYKLILNELIKHSRSKISYLGIICIILSSLVMVKSIAFTSSELQYNGFSFLITTMLGVCTSILPLFATIFSSIIVANEATRGTLRVILTQPVRRIEFLIAKWIISIFYMLFLLSIALLIIVIYAQFTYDFKDITEENLIVYTKTEMIFSLFKSFLFLLFPLIATVTYGFFISVISKNVAVAVGGAVGTLFTIEPIKHLLKFKYFNLTNYIFTSYLDLPLIMSSDMASGVGNPWKSDLSDINKLVIVSLIYIVLCWGLSLVVFLKRDLN